MAHSIADAEAKAMWQRMAGRSLNCIVRVEGMKLKAN